VVHVSELSSGAATAGMYGGRREVEKKKGWACPNLLSAVGANPRMEQDFLVLMVKLQLSISPQCQ